MRGSLATDGNVTPTDCAGQLLLGEEPVCLRQHFYILILNVLAAEILPTPRKVSKSFL